MLTRTGAPKRGDRCRMQLGDQPTHLPSDHPLARALCCGPGCRGFESLTGLARARRPVQQRVPRASAMTTATSSATAAPAKADMEPMPGQKRLGRVLVLIPGISRVAAGGWWYLFGWDGFPGDHAAAAGGWDLFRWDALPGDPPAWAGPRCPEKQPPHHAQGARA